jgi:uncharacterized protein (DUF3084 family)
VKRSTLRRLRRELRDAERLYARLTADEYASKARVDHVVKRRADAKAQVEACRQAIAALGGRLDD